MKFSFVALFHLIILGAIIAAAVRASETLDQIAIYCTSYIIAAVAFSRYVMPVLNSYASKQKLENQTRGVNEAQLEQLTQNPHQAITTALVFIINCILLLSFLNSSLSIGNTYLLIASTLCLACSLRPPKSSKPTRILFPRWIQFMVILSSIVTILFLADFSLLWLVYLATIGVEMGLPDPALILLDRPRVIDAERAFTQSFVGLLGVVLWFFSAMSCFSEYRSKRLSTYRQSWLFVLASIIVTVIQYMALLHDFPYVWEVIRESALNAHGLEVSIVLILGMCLFSQYVTSNSESTAAEPLRIADRLKQFGLGVIAITPLMMFLVEDIKDGNFNLLAANFLYFEFDFLLIAALGISGLQIIARNKSTIGKQHQARSPKELLQIYLMAGTIIFGITVLWYATSFYLHAALCLIPISILP